MEYGGKQHTFVVCAYKESPYLRNCLRSLQRQTVKSNIMIATSTPNDYIRRIAQRMNVPVVENESEVSGIARDWNFAYAQADTELVTLAHQDDIYEPDYLQQVLAALNRAKRPILAHTAYYEIRNGKKVRRNQLLLVKKLMLLPFAFSGTWNSIALRRCSLSLGCAICCPSVTYVKKELPKEVFLSGYAANLDWQAWERYSKQKGAFCYVSRPLMGHRVHQASETSRVIGEGSGRTGEDYDMYRKFWPDWIATALVRLYAKGQDSNHL